MRKGSANIALKKDTKKTKEKRLSSAQISSSFIENGTKNSNANRKLFWTAYLRWSKRKEMNEYGWFSGKEMKNFAFNFLSISGHFAWNAFLLLFLNLFSYWTHFTTCFSISSSWHICISFHFCRQRRTKNAGNSEFNYPTQTFSDSNNRQY